VLTEKSHILLSLFAALVFMVAGLIRRMPPDNMVFWLIVILIVFYIAGLFLRGALRKNTAAGTQPKKDDIEMEGQRNK